MVHQRDSRERKKFITFMILPHNSMREVFRLHLPGWAAKLLIGLTTLTIISIIGFFLYSATITSQLVQYWALKVENKIQDQQIKSFYEKTKKLETGIRELEERDQELREMLGLQKTKKTSQRIEDINNPASMNERIASIEQYISEKKEEFKVLQAASTALAYHYDNLPSLAPVVAPLIYQKMGWRMHPILGRSEFHKGVDIPIWVGYPVRAAAGGHVIYSDWAKGYGYTIIVDHENGYKTIYGHNSRLLVQKGARIQKGQVICKAGSTGLSTGPHVHYEVQHFDKVVDPEKFIDLDMRTASAYYGLR